MSKKPLIEKIEISYFRSIHSGAMKRCKPLNIVVGGNDSGKSNVLRALNLFFHNETDLGHEYDFDQDLSLKRVMETQKGKTKAFLNVKITFNNVFGYRSLPETFVVKKQWNRYSKTPDTYVFPKTIKQNTLYRFLNKIELHYVPAVKSKEIFKYYLQLLYDTLVLKDIKLLEASSDITDVINDATEYMSGRIKEGIGVTSNIAVPKNFRELFGDMDFITQIGETEKISLKQRGDGVQVGHIPYILDFIAKENSGKHYIWLYEEPENSLEMKKAFELAGRFLKDFSKNNQIFITTHSPAFYSLEGENISKWRIEKTMSQQDGQSFSISEIEELDKFQGVDDSLGVTALISERAKEVYLENAALSKKVDSFKKATKPMVLCEGKTDVKYIKKYLELMNQQELLNQIDIQEANPDGQGTGCDVLKKIKQSRKVHPYQYHSKALLVFDCDVEKIVSETINEKTEVFKFALQPNLAFTSGVENALSPEVVALIEADDTMWKNEVIEQKGGHKKGVIKLLDKMAACNFVCSRNNVADFVWFVPLLSKIQELVSND
ncbi:MAG: ATP-dependent nuclease [Alcanivorax sp.]